VRKKIKRRRRRRQRRKYQTYKVVNKVSPFLLPKFSFLDLNYLKINKNSAIIKKLKE
jgi:hypothetical protein